MSSCTHDKTPQKELRPDAGVLLAGRSVPPEAVLPATVRMMPGIVVSVPETYAEVHDRRSDHDGCGGHIHGPPGNVAHRRRRHIHGRRRRNIDWRRWGHVNWSGHYRQPDAEAEVHARLGGHCACQYHGSQKHLFHTLIRRRVHDRSSAPPGFFVGIFFE